MIATIFTGLVIYFLFFLPDMIDKIKRNKLLNNTATCEKYFKGYVSPEGVNNGNEEN